MNRIFTTTGILAAVILFFASFSAAAQSTQGGSATLISFTSTPVLVSGTALTTGAKYKFTNVASGTDAYVTIVSETGGATVSILDDNSLTKPEAFSPAINVPAHSNGLVEFKIEFINGGGNPKTQSLVVATAMDIDGNVNLHEVDVLDMGAGSIAAYVNPTVEISMVQTGTTYTGTNTGGIEYTGVDTAAKQVMFTVQNSSIDHFTYKAGANNNGTATSRQKGIYFKTFDYTLRPLPVKLVSFTGALQNKNVMLSWITANEINNSHFEVERSFNGKDFSQVGIALDGFEDGAGKDYAFKDNSALQSGKAIAYYRLKQIDLDGKFTYSNIVSVRLQNTADVSMSVSPNPFTAKVNVSFNSSETGNADVRIMNVSGNILLTKKVSVINGTNNIEIAGLSTLPAGVYTAILAMNGKLIAAQKIIK